MPGAAADIKSQNKLFGERSREKATRLHPLKCGHALLPMKLFQAREALSDTLFLSGSPVRAPHASARTIPLTRSSPGSIDNMHSMLVLTT